jgi:D-alanyl-D-alanine carboxypeptidase
LNIERIIMKATIRILGTLALGLIIGASGALPGAAQSSVSRSLQTLWSQAWSQPDDFAIGCIGLNSSSTFTANANERFPLASVSKLLIYIEYSRRLDLGVISPYEMVDVATLERYNLPQTDRGAHDRFMQQYPIGTTSISLWELARGMIQYSSNAASDYLLDRLYPTDWGSLYRLLGLTGTDVPHSLTLIPLLMNNHVTGQPTRADVDQLSVEQGENYLNMYVSNDSWRADEIRYREGRRRDFPRWEIQAAILDQHTAHGSITDFLRVMSAIYRLNSPLSESTQQRTRFALRWMDNTYINANYLEYGSKLGFYSGGVLALVAYGQPYNGEPILSVMFFRNIPRSTYRELLQADAIGDFAHWINFNGCANLSSVVPSDQ